MDRAARAALQRELSRLRDGDRGAFHPVFSLLAPEVRDFAGRHASAEEAEDVTQATLLAIFARASEFDPARDALAWALGIAGWELRTARRKSARRRETADGATALAFAAAGGPSPEDLAIARDLESAVTDVVGGLDTGDLRTMIALLRGESPTDVPAATFRKRVERALARARTAWRTTHGDE